MEEQKGGAPTFFRTFYKRVPVPLLYGNKGSHLRLGRYTS